MNNKIITIVGNDRIKANDIIAEERLNFILSVLLASGIPEYKIESCLTDGEISSTENRIAFRKLCKKEQISIVDNNNGGMKIYVKSVDEDVLIAEWYQPFCVLRIQARKLFTEVHLSWWTFEEK